MATFVIQFIIGVLLLVAGVVSCAKKIEKAEDGMIHALFAFVGFMIICFAVVGMYD